MPRPRKVLPRYLEHSSGKARAVWTDASGQRRERQLPGAFSSTESLAAFARLQLELASSTPKPVPSGDGLTVAEVLLPYVLHAEQYYGDGTEAPMIKDALKVVRELYGAEPVAEFGPRKLAAVREAFVQLGWSRPYCNRQTQKIVRAFKWAVAEELIPASIYQALKALAPLRRGHCAAPEPTPRQPANPEHVVAAMPLLPPHSRAIVELIRLTGMRPAEACRMTLSQLDRSGAIWLYRLAAHKNAHRGHSRIVHLGAAAQAVINAHLDGRKLGEDEPLFSPRRQREERYAALRVKRKTRVQPSQANRKRAKPRKLPGTWFTPTTINRAVAVACEKAKVPLWSPYQLRHLKGAELRQRFSLEHVRAALGHSHASMSAHYSTGADGKLASEVAAAEG